MTWTRTPLQQFAQEVVDLLSNIEFADNSGQEYDPACPSCGYRIPRHERGCVLNVLARKAERLAKGEIE